MKQLPAILLFWLAWSPFSYAQFTDDFSDGNFNQNPTWLGDTSHFIVDTLHFRLRQQAPTGFTRSQLRTRSRALHQASWEWWMQLDFNPSSSNYADVYLVSNQPNLDSSLQGYFVRIGNTTDEVSLYRQTGNTRTKIIDGIDGLLDRNQNILKVKVTRSASGIWELFSDTSGTGQHYYLEGSVQDNTIGTAEWFGLRHVYTTTRANGFHYDQFVVSGGPIPDTLPPALLQAALIGEQAIQLHLNKSIPDSLLSIRQQYELLGFGTPIRANPLPNNQVLLEWLLPFPDPAWLNLDISLSDSAGNRLDTSISILKRRIQPGDVVINELLIRESPPVNLPETEFVELYNPTDFPIQLLNWHYGDLQSTAILGAYELPPKGYLILCPRNRVQLWSAFGDVLEVHPWPNLNNDRDELFLRNAENLLIDTVFYESGWLEPAFKQQGGWTLERVDAASLCLNPSNWKASLQAKGGSPGSTNSVAGTPAAGKLPELLQALYLGSDSLLLLFSKAVTAASVRIGTHSLNIPNTQHPKVEWRLALTPLKQQDDVLLELSGWYDCHGRHLPDITRKLFIGQEAEAGQLHINEIYYRTTTGGSQYFELLNSGKNAVLLQNLRMGMADEAGIPTQSLRLCTYPLLIEPGGRMMFSRDTAAVSADIGPTVSKNRWQTDNWPNMLVSGGRLAIFKAHGEILALEAYHDSLHHPMLRENRGIALEKAEGAPQGRFSSAILPSRGSPGSTNSRKLTAGETAGFGLEPKILRLQELGSVLIWFEAEKPGMLQISLHDENGNERCRLIPQQFVEGRFTFEWRGECSGQGLPTGQYILKASYYNEQEQFSRMSRLVVSQFKP
ncbi:MAG: lamin tail domain-containing protein [Bacteroidia bacterium]